MKVRDGFTEEVACRGWRLFASWQNDEQSLPAWCVATVETTIVLISLLISLG